MFDEWTSVHWIMSIYIGQGIIIAILNIPLVVKLLQKKYRHRKELVLIVCVSIVDFSYVICNTYNSWNRFTTDEGKTTRKECVSQPMMFLGLISNQLVAIMPLMIAIDRFIASKYGFWYYKQSSKYSFVLCFVPCMFSTVITTINQLIIFSGEEGDQIVSAYCFTLLLTAPSFLIIFHFIKWFCILLAGIFYIIVYLTLLNKKINVNFQGKRIKTANLVMGFSTINSIVFHLIPDFILVIKPIWLNIVHQSILYSLIMDKIFFNFILYMIFHKEIRSIYLSMFSIFKRTQSTSSGVNSGNCKAVIVKPLREPNP